jgi:hypothetical protein
MSFPLEHNTEKILKWSGFGDTECLSHILSEGYHCSIVGSQGQSIPLDTELPGG